MMRKPKTLSYLQLHLDAAKLAYSAAVLLGDQREARLQQKRISKLAKALRGKLP